MDRTQEAERLLWYLCSYKSSCALDQTAYAVCLAMEERSRLAHVTKEVYPEVAIRFRTSWRNVERNIRNVRDTIWENGERERLEKISGIKFSKRPTNTELLTILTDYLLYQEREAFRKELAVSDEVIKPSIVERITVQSAKANERKEIAQMAEKIVRLEKNNEQLKQRVQRLHDMIWDLLRKIKGV